MLSNNLTIFLSDWYYYANRHNFVKLRNQSNKEAIKLLLGYVDSLPKPQRNKFIIKRKVSENLITEKLIKTFLSNDQISSNQKDIVANDAQLARNSIAAQCWSMTNNVGDLLFNTVESTIRLYRDMIPDIDEESRKPTLEIKALLDAIALNPTLFFSGEELQSALHSRWNEYSTLSFVLFHIKEEEQFYLLNKIIEAQPIPEKVSDELIEMFGVSTITYRVVLEWLARYKASQNNIDPDIPLDWLYEVLGIVDSETVW